MRSLIRLFLAPLALCAFTTLALGQAAPAAPPSAPTSRPAPTPEQAAAGKLMNEQDPAVAAPKVSNVDGTINPSFAKQHESFLARGKQGPIDLLFLGDSITAGWATRGKEVWAERYPDDKYHPANFGIGGDKTQHVLWRIDNGELDGIHPKALVLMIGTNNSANKDAADIANGVTAIVKGIQAKLPQTKILLLGIFPRGENPADPKVAAIRDKLKATNAIIAKLDDGQHVFYLDIGDKFLQPDGVLPKTMFPDSLHPNADGYKIWADAIQPKLDELMK